ncbi:MAG: alpha-2-macroglobulin family protein, partial [Chitinophagaceae bacterium]
STFPQTISGIIRDNNEMPVVFATIRVKGANIATTSNERGEFVLRTPKHGSIVISAVGFTEQELPIHSSEYHIILIPSKSNMSEVVVVGYGTVKKREVSASVSTINAQVLQGKVAGLMVRGSTTIEASQPLIIVDGLPYSGKLEDLDKNDIDKINILKSTEATAVYGSAAAGGVILVTTKKQKLSAENGEPFAGNTLRRNFRDDAYWQPKLTTNANGYASFKVTFPDDITNWQTFTIAMADNKRSGYAEGAIKSFKALSGNITLPLFAVDGDSINVIGKTLNYLSDTVEIKRSFSLNNNLVKENNIRLRNSWIDTFSITAPQGDSLKLKYTVQKEDGYFDGEERTIPVFRPGVLETNGIFLALSKDTTFTVQLKADSASIKLYAESSLLPVFYEETESIRNYEYLCNEQLASKLKAMLVQKRIDKFLNRPFNGEKNINDLIARLNKSKSTTGLWGWWTGNQPSLWISLHVTEALLDADRMGYPNTLNKAALGDYLIFNLESYRGIDKLSSLYLLHALGTKADFKKYIDTLDKYGVGNSLYQKLRLTELKQKLGLPVVIDTFIAKQNRTVFGNVYWGEENYYFFDNSFQITLSMYRILRNSGTNNELMMKARNYFLEKRRNGHWRNTYESSLILETILPDLLAENTGNKPASLTIKGKETIVVEKFPFQTQIKSGENISVTKQGSMPVYFTAYEQHWNKAPERVEGNFVVKTVFEKGAGTTSTLKAGVPVTLRVSVEVKADAEYVMVEIPIPAGCSYQDKSQSYWGQEVHREYFKNKVSIFCNSLVKGKYSFTVSLLPRYTGVYT